MLSFLAAISTVAAYNVSVAANATTSTEIVTAYTTYCPYPTTFTEGSSTYTVTEPTTLTITDCPCTRTHTFSTETVTVCPSGSAASTGVAIVGPGNTAAPNSSAPAVANGAMKQGVSLAAAAGAIVVAGLL